MTMTELIKPIQKLEETNGSPLEVRIYFQTERIYGDGTGGYSSRVWDKNIFIEDGKVWVTVSGADMYEEDEEEAPICKYLDGECKEPADYILMSRADLLRKNDRDQYECEVVPVCEDHLHKFMLGDYLIAEMETDPQRYVIR